jgi:hypothetical protein
MAGCSVPGAFLLLLALPLLVPAVPGIGVQIQPDTTGDRSPISISLSNITDGYDLNITLTARFMAAQNTSWLNFTDWNYPFALGGGGVTVSGRNVNQLTLLVQTGTTLKTRRETGTGNITMGVPMDFPAVIYHDFRIGYEVHSPDIPLVLTLTQEGIKSGPADAVLTPTVLGVGEGNLTVEVLANDTLQAEKEIRILKEPPPTPTVEGNATVSPSPSTATPSPATTRATTRPATTRPAPAPSPSPSPGGTPSPATPDGISPWILGFITGIIVIALVSDYLLLRD